MADPISAAIFDLDGTLMDVRHRLHLIKHTDKPDWPAFFDACVNDTPIEYVVELNHILYRHYPAVFICSGRPDSHREISELMLKAAGVRYHHMYMRAMRDYRHDTEVKLEMLNDIRKRGFKPKLAIDDRPEVVRMWRDNGVPCLVVDDAEWHT